MLNLIADEPQAGGNPADPLSRAELLGRHMIGIVTRKLGAAPAVAWVDAILTPTLFGTPERDASDKAIAQLSRNVLAVAGDLVANRTAAPAGEGASAGDAA